MFIAERRAVVSPSSLSFMPPSPPAASVYAPRSPAPPPQLAPRRQLTPRPQCVARPSAPHAKRVASDSVKVCVYGSLMPKMRNAYRLENADSTCMGPCRTAPEYRLYDSGNVPAVCAGGKTPIHGFLYEVGPATLRELDVMEGHPNGRYKREEITLAAPTGERAWIYIAPKKKVDWGSLLVPSGDWALQKRGITVPALAAKLGLP